MFFVKACALGNDFVIISPPYPEYDPCILSQMIADRRYGIGCDQVIFLNRDYESWNLSFYNADGSQAEACGNGTRSVALWLSMQTLKNNFTILTKGGAVNCSVEKDIISTTYNIDPILEEIEDYLYVNVGNPHLVFFSENLRLINEIGPKYSQSTEKGYVNVEVANVIGKNIIEVCVFERGVGVTPACGTGALATFIASKKRFNIDNNVKVVQAGGELWISKENECDYKITGRAQIVFSGQICIDFLSKK